MSKCRTPNTPRASNAWLAIPMHRSNARVFSLAPRGTSGEGALESGHFPPNSLAEANPQGCQRVAGGRSGQRGNDHRKACFGLAHPGGVPDRTPTSNRSGTPAGVQDLCYAVTRRPPPPESPRRHPATLWQPFGLTAVRRGSKLGNTSAGRCLVAALALTASLAPAQEALRNSMAGDAAAEARNLQQQSQAYTVKSGDFRLLVTPSVGFDWNSNINAAHTNALQDFILFPALGLDMSYPLTQGNLLRLNVVFGYQDYLEHSEYSTWNVQSGSALSYDIYVKDFWINLHERFSYVQNSSQQAAVANTGTYGTGQNTAGFNTTWDLADTTLSLGYDHQNVFSTSQQYNYTDHASELVVGRGGFKFHPTLTAGLEGTISSTAYDQPVLNNNMGYSAGVYADWQPGHYLHVQPRFGYTIYQSQQTSQTIPASNQNAWYLDLTATHDISDAVSYSFSAGHELTLGIYGDTIEDWYVRTMLSLRIVRDLTLNTSFSYQNGTQGIQYTPGSPTVPGSASENYNWFTWSIGLSRPLIKRLTIGLNYQLTLRTSNYASRAYNQNLVGLQLTYNLP